MRGGSQGPFEIFPKIHPFWYHHLSLIKLSILSTLSGTVNRSDSEKVGILGNHPLTPQKCILNMHFGQFRALF